MDRAFKYIGCMFSVERDWVAFSPFFYLNRFNVFVLILAILLSIGAGNYLRDILKKIFSIKAFCIIKFIGFCFLWIIVTVDPFIYFRF